MDRADINSNDAGGRKRAGCINSAAMKFGRTSTLNAENTMSLPRDQLANLHKAHHFHYCWNLPIEEPTHLGRSESHLFIETNKDEHNLCFAHNARRCHSTGRTAAYTWTKAKSSDRHNQIRVLTFVAEGVDPRRELNYCRQTQSMSIPSLCNN